MSEILKEYKKREVDYKLKVGSEAPLSYVNRQLHLHDEILFTVDIPWPILQLWRDVLEGVSSEDANFIDLLNSTVVDGWFVLKRDCKRIESLLNKKASDVKISYRKTSGRKRQELDDKVYRLSVRRGEIDSTEVDKSEIKKCRDEAEILKRKCGDLENEIKIISEEMVNETKRLEEEIVDLKKVNKELADYVEILEKYLSLNCQGKTMTEVGNKQKGRKLKLLKNRAQCALWFCRSYGLELSHIKLQDTEGSNYNLDFQNDTTPSDLKESDKENLENFLLDKFCVGDEVYHELSILSDDLPKSYLIKQLRSDLNKTYHIERTAGKCPGAKLNFPSTLSVHVEELLLHKPELKNDVVKVKVSGDGARMSCSTNFMMMSFALLQGNEKVMSSKSNRTVAIINGPEDYEILKGSLPLLFKEINELIRTGSILINNEHVKLEFFLGGDLKFLLMMLGLSSATADYACLWCKVHKDNRWDTSKGMDFYNQEPNRRTLKDIIKCLESEDCFSCKNKPLLDIEVDHVVPDELHLLLRVTDRLLQNVIDEVRERDSIDSWNKSKGQPKDKQLNNLVKGINDCGIPFKIWYKKNTDGSASKIVDFTSLVGSQKKKLLNKLPTILHKYLYPDTCPTVCKIWTSFEEYYNTISDFNLTNDCAINIFDKGKAWIKLFCSLKDLRPGYTRARVTPYMHLMVYHVPYFVQNYGCFKQFTGQGVEKNNDDAKRVMFHKSNKWDAATDILRTESRQWDLKEREREKGTYIKRKFEYWEGDINNRSEKRIMLNPATPVPVDAEDNSSSGPNNSNTLNYRKCTVKELITIVKAKALHQKGLSKLKKVKLIALLEGS